MSSTLTSGKRRTRRLATLAIGAAVVTTVGLTAPAATAATAPAAPAADDLTVVTGTTPQSTDPADYEAGTYIVRFADEPLATYDGDVRGYTATKPAKGEKIDVDSAAADKYEAHLVEQQESALDEVGAEAEENLTVVLNAATVQLSPQQAADLAGTKSVVAITKTELMKPQTDQSPQFLQMPKLWSEAGGRWNAGRDIVVGVVDTGIWYESASFRPFAKNSYNKPPQGWNGECVLGADGTGEPCNGKIIGARYYVDDFGIDNISPEEFLSPRDGDGHGSHTASTAAGQVVRNVNVDGTDFGTVSGMAPGAQIAAYKVCWTGIEDDGCATGDMVNAIEDAVADGVDVINFSIGGGSESQAADPVEIAYLNAAAAGVFVSASAGNSGPGESTFDHVSPWLTTVAASTHKINEKKLVLGDGREFIGASSTNELPSQTPMVLSRDAAAEGADVQDATLCVPGSLDPAVVAGKLVVCERGVIARVDKSLAVRDAGGAGMVLINPTPNSVNADLHYVPSIHLDDEAYEPVTTYVESDPAPTGAILALDADDESGTQVPTVADFSSRGPSTTTGGDILKPDIAAPGVDVLAAVTPYNHNGRDYDLLSGTSMAAPHVAGIAAVIKSVHEDWSPMEIKSAMMTTARDTVGTTSPFEQGAGNVQPSMATRPGVVFDHDVTDWLGFLVHEGYAQIPGITPVSGTDLNQASIAAGSVPGTITTQRTMTSTAKNQTFRFSADLPGWRVTTDTPLVRFSKVGETKTVTLTFTKNASTPTDEWATGYVYYTGADKTRVRMPVTMRATTLSIDQTDIHTTGTPSGSETVTVTPGFTGTLSTTVRGLVGTVPVTDTLVANSEAFDPTAPAAGPSVDVYPLTTNDTTALRMSVDANDASDFDLYVYRVTPAGERVLVAYSATGSPDEEVTLTTAAPLTGLQLEAYVHAYSGTDGTYAYRAWDVPNTAAGNLTVDPATAQVTAAEPEQFTLAWDGLVEEQDYFGWVGFSAPDGAGKKVFVEVR